MNKEDEIRVAYFFRNFEELPLFNPFPDFPLSIKVVVYVLSLPINRRLVQNDGKFDGPKCNDVHGLSGMKGQRRLAVTSSSSQDDDDEGQSRSES
jgi:hypothetical protein